MSVDEEIDETCVLWWKANGKEETKQMRSSFYKEASVLLAMRWRKRKEAPKNKAVMRRSICISQALVQRRRRMFRNVAGK